MIATAVNEECPACGASTARCACAATEAQRLGRVIAGRYRIERRLGTGGMGVVYEARHVSLGRRFAIKFLLRRYSDDPRIAKRFETEALTAGRLEHPNLVAVVDAGRDEGSLFLVMEHLDGEDARRLLRRVGPLPVRRAVDLVRQACRGVAVAHGAGVLHRDLKPENLFVSRDGHGADHVDILDFGIAKHLAGDPGSSTTGATPGTAYYMSPEQARGDGELDVRSDVWALGVVLYELLAGRRPFEGESFLKIAMVIVREDAPELASLRPGLPAGLADVVRKAMHRDRAARFASASALADALAPFAPAHALAEERSHVSLDTATAPSPSAPSVSVEVSARASSRGGMRARGAPWLAFGAGSLVTALVLAPRWREPPSSGSAPEPAAASANAAPSVEPFDVSSPVASTATVESAPAPAPSAAAVFVMAKDEILRAAPPRSGAGGPATARRSPPLPASAAPARTGHAPDIETADPYGAP